MIDTERVRALMNEMGISQAELARRVKVTPPAIQQLLSGRTKRTSLVPALATVLNASTDYIEGKSDRRHRPVASALSDDETNLDLVQFVYGFDPNFKDELTADTDLSRAMYNDRYDPYWVQRQVARVSPELFEEHGPDFAPQVNAIFMASTAMAPTIQKGDHLLLSAQSKKVHGEDEIWGVVYGGVHLIRRVMLLPNNRGYLISADNPAAPSFEAALDEVELAGRVFWLGRMA